MSCFLARILQLAGYVYFLSVFSKIQAPKLLILVPRNRNFVQVKGHKYLSFFKIFPKLRQENPLNKQINLNCLSLKPIDFAVRSLRSPLQLAL